MSVKVAEELTARARRLGLAGSVHYSITNGPGWRYQWCPNHSKWSKGLGDSRAEARRELGNMAACQAAWSKR